MPSSTPPRQALTLHQWLQEPDFDQEGEVQRAEKLLDAEAGPVPLLAAAAGFRVWIDAGETRPAMRAALVRFWVRSRLLRTPVPLTGAAAFSAEQGLVARSLDRGVPARHCR